jgi:hypothetical protein
MYVNDDWWTVKAMIAIAVNVEWLTMVVTEQWLPLSAKCWVGAREPAGCPRAGGPAAGRWLLLLLHAGGEEEESSLGVPLCLTASNAIERRREREREERRWWVGDGGLVG